MNEKNVLIIYHSQYGNTKKYAELIGNKLNVDPIDVDSINDKHLEDSDIVVYGCGLYAGKIYKGNLIKDHLDKKVIVFTVGVVDPKTTDIKSTLDANFSESEQRKIKFFHLRGGMDYKTLSFTHKMMMWVLAKIIINRIPLSKRTEEQKYIQNNYKEKMDFFEVEKAQEIADYVMELL